MFDILNRFFGSKVEKDVSRKESQPEHDPLIATCALFLEMAQIDEEFNDEERTLILGILRDEYGLSGEYAQELTTKASEEVKDSLDLWKFTNRVNQYYSEEEKIGIIELIWKIIYVDGKLDRHEDYLIHKLGKLLNLRHSQLINAKLTVLENRE